MSRKWRRRDANILSAAAAAARRSVMTGGWGVDQRNVGGGAHVFRDEALYKYTCRPTLLYVDSPKFHQSCAGVRSPHPHKTRLADNDHYQGKRFRGRRVALAMQFYYSSFLATCNCNYQRCRDKAQ